MSDNTIALRLALSGSQQVSAQLTDIAGKISGLIGGSANLEYIERVLLN